MKAARWATVWATGWGVVTTYISAVGRKPASEIEISPVPGGRSTSR